MLIHSSIFLSFFLFLAIIVIDGIKKRKRKQRMKKEKGKKIDGRVKRNQMKINEEGKKKNSKLS